MDNPTLFYAFQNYFSHQRCALDYCHAIDQQYDRVSEAGLADVVILHYEPHLYKTLFSSFPYLRKKYVIGFAVWEADILPEAYQQGISLLDEIWTPSHFSLSAFENKHHRVRYVPHVVRRDKQHSTDDLETIKSLIQYDDRATYILNISQVSDKRKNIHQLLDAFTSVQQKLPQAKLIIKNFDGKTYRAQNDSIIFINRFLSTEEINALYRLCHLYVSAHHAEGWGLALSDAMLFHKPVIATGYSGNMEFMNAENSFLVDYDLENIRPQDCFGHFTSEMKWAYPLQRNLEGRMFAACRGLEGSRLNKMIEAAAKSVSQFSLTNISEIIRQFISEIREAFCST